MAATVNEKDYMWMVRPCQMYKEEYSDCTSIKARFHQYFIYGETVDCTQWKRDYDNCVRWNDDSNSKALKEIIESERTRIRKRLDAHYKNNVWTKRKEPPADWNKPLPERLIKEYENSYLQRKANEMANKPSQKDEVNRTVCVIS